MTKEQYTKTITLTPHLAGKLLASNYENQRTLGVNKAEAMARDIRGGRWNNKIAWADPLMLTPGGKLMNGQHRCKAVILADKPITVDVRYNVPEEYFTNIDNGRSRDATQFIKTKNASIVGSVAKFANCIELGRSLTHAINGRVADAYGNRPVSASRSELLEYINNNTSELEQIAAKAQKIVKAFQGGSKAMVASALWLISYIDRPLDTTALIERFAEDVCRNTPTHPAIVSGKNYALSRQLAAARDNVRLNSEFWLGLTLAMYDAFGTRKTKLVKGDIDKALKKYSDVVDELRGAKK